MKPTPWIRVAGCCTTSLFVSISLGLLTGWVMATAGNLFYIAFLVIPIAGSLPFVVINRPCHSVAYVLGAACVGSSGLAAAYVPFVYSVREYLSEATAPEETIAAYRISSWDSFQLFWRAFPESMGTMGFIIAAITAIVGFLTIESMAGTPSAHHTR